MNDLEKAKKFAYETIIELDKTKIEILSGNMLKFVQIFSKIKTVEISKITVDKNIFDDEEIFNNEELLLSIAHNAKELNKGLIYLNYEFEKAVGRLNSVIDFFGTDYKTYNEKATAAVFEAFKIAERIKFFLDISILEAL